VLEVTERGRVIATITPSSTEPDAPVVVLAARHRTTRLLTLDERDFRPMRPLYGTAFTLIPADTES